jgi:hypothetical protein
VGLVGLEPTTSSLSGSLRHARVPTLILKPLLRSTEWFVLVRPVRAVSFNGAYVLDLILRLGKESNRPVQSDLSGRPCRGPPGAIRRPSRKEDTGESERRYAGDPSSPSRREGGEGREIC